MTRIARLALRAAAVVSILVLALLAALVLDMLLGTDYTTRLTWWQLGGLAALGGVAYGVVVLNDADWQWKHWGIGKR